MSLFRTSLKLLKLYLKLALLHTAWKLTYVYLRKVKTELLWKNVPGYKMDYNSTRLKSYGRRRHDYYADSGRNFPNAPFVKLDLQIPSLLVNTPDALKWVASDNFENITKPQGDEDVFDLLSRCMGPKSFSLIGHGKFLPDDNAIWLFQRKTLIKIFSKSTMDSFFRDTFVEAANRMNKKLLENVGSFIDMQALNMAGTMDAGYKMFLGIETNNVFNGLSEFHKNFNKANLMILAVAGKILEIRATARRIMPFPFGTLTPTKNSKYTLTEFYLSRYNSTYRNFIELTNQNDQAIQDIINEAKADSDLKSRQDVLANFIKNDANDEVLKNIVRAMIMAGGETSATFLSWLFFEISSEPEIQTRLATEIISSFGQDQIPHYDDITAEKLPFLNACLYETLRLHPGVPTIGRRPQCDLVYIDGTVIPKGTTLAISLYGSLRNPDKFPDPLKFNPDRWIPFQNPDSTVFTNFYTGPRNCPGKDVAIFEAKLMTCMILRKFKFELMQGEKEKVTYSSSISNCICNDPVKQTTNLWLRPSLRES